MIGVNVINLEIQQGHEYHVFIDKKIYDKSKFFYPVYKKSADIIKEICSHPKAESNDNFAKYYPNNIIMFCAERGGGKSSAMISFAHALKYIDNQVNKSEQNDFNDMWGDIPIHNNFAVLDVIDPTAIFEQEIFMRIILSRMFAELRNLWETSDKNNYDDCSMRSNILSKFRKCYGLIDVIYQNRGKFDSNDDLADLSDLGDSINLKKEFKELVDCFLEQQFGRRKNNYLVIQLDDADLNTKMTYQIIEDIRKYCIIPNVIVLMAADMVQMNQIIEQHFIAEFKTLLDVSRNMNGYEPISYNDTKDMAVRYINKLMPSAHRIYLPKVSDYLKNNACTLKLSYIRKNDDEEADLLSYTDNDESSDSITEYQERLCRLVFRKTGIALVRTENYTHNFFPQNMRELAHFLSYFCSLPDLNIDIGFAELFSIIYNNNKINNILKEQANDELKRRKNNLEAFEQYFVYNWADFHLNRNYCRYISELADTTDSLQINSALNICSTIQNSNKQSNENDNISDENNPPVSKNSYAELMDKLSFISKNAMENRDFAERYKIVYAFHLLFSIFLHKEALSSIENSNFKWLYKIVNGELWTQNCNIPLSSMQYGRFTVDYHILRQIMPSMKLVDDKQQIVDDYDKLSELCYLRSRNNNLKIDMNDLGIKQTLKAMESCNSENKENIIIYDVRMSLFNALTNKNNYTNNIDDLLRLNKIYYLLMNWDVRHYVEKTIKTINSAETTPTEWRDFFLSEVNKALGNLVYLFPKNSAPLSGTESKIIEEVCLSNKTIAQYTVNQVFEQLKNASMFFSSDEGTDTIQMISDFLQLKDSYLNTLTVQIERLKPFLTLSDGITKMSDKISAISTLININESKLKNAVDATSDTELNPSEETKKLLEQVSSQLTEWKQYIGNPNLKKEIISDIDAAFSSKSHSRAGYNSRFKKAPPKTTKKRR